ncbi:hypothetical protein ZWY2020_010490 [Hordeum vulgare]|nr:hypothetical protein ZWY2020_010490 [Hordeum vulgare]
MPALGSLAPTARRISRARPLFSVSAILSPRPAPGDIVTGFASAELLDPLWRAGVDPPPPTFSRPRLERISRLMFEQNESEKMQSDTSKHLT